MQQFFEKASSGADNMLLACRDRDGLLHSPHAPKAIVKRACAQWYSSLPNHANSCPWGLEIRCLRFALGLGLRMLQDDTMHAPYGGILALRAHCALLLDYVPTEEPLGTPLGNTLRIRRPKLDWRGP